MSRNTSFEHQKNVILVLVVDEQAAFRLGISALVESIPTMKVCGEAESGSVAMQMCLDLRPDLVVLDAHLHDLDSFDLAKCITERCPAVRLLMLSTHDQAIFAARAYKSGASGYACKSDGLDELTVALKTVGSQGTYLTPSLRDDVLLNIIINLQDETPPSAPKLDSLSLRQRQILEFMGEGKSRHDIARSLGVSVKTVETHRGHAMKKLRLSSSREMQRLARDLHQLAMGENFHSDAGFAEEGFVLDGRIDIDIHPPPRSMIAAPQPAKE